ncbi:hypothetical protein SmJEL517_g01018 [Synchytrium microbalum]|uniref:Presequence protease, mitochondrial n=1 Tax=Synchytrium microbalum TaxID=1806994 RepID=A0A507CD89_9FUNG|nr:uncharacterized protein SmJEL517_g01018 [Synchytrium microbalum]TPX37139.1 hypothetical protein SmJEL517_g01018 [Synchytrium microbalum]
MLKKSAHQELYLKPLLSYIVDSFRVNTSYSGFNFKEATRIDEFALDVFKFEHEKTRTLYYHVHKADASNNVFCVAFKTPPSNSTGVPHILEHTVLCGSAKYPVRDPFFKMLNRSLSTYMNALTGSDITMYPFSSENEQDYRNLMSVYMDSVFRPKLDELSFKQEGWRLEHSNPRDASSPLIFKGVVYNEMKGALSNPGDLFLTRLQQQLYPNSTYGYVSGGDPVNIPDLTWHSLKDFHAQCYHPSNACFVTYGNFSLDKHLEMIDSNIRDFSVSKALDAPRVEKWSAPKNVVEYGPLDPMLDPEKQTKMAISFLANKSTEVYEAIALRVLTSLLIDGAASPMYQALIDSQLGSDYSPSTGYDRTATTTNLSFGLQGMKKSDVEQVQEKIRNVLKSARDTGFKAERVDAIVHEMELSLKHRQANFGMMIAQSMSSHFAHGGDPVESLEVNKHIKRLKEEIATTDLLPRLIDQYCITNPHQLTYVMHAEEEYYDKLAKKETDLLSSKVAGLSDWERRKAFEDGARLIKTQDEKEDLSVLPTLSIEQVMATEPKQYTVSDVPLGAGAVTAQIRETDTNGVSYVTLSRDLSGLDPDLVKYLPLYCSTLTSLGTTTSPLPVLSEKIRGQTGGISVSSLASSSPFTLDQTGMSLHITSSSLTHNIDNMYKILQEVITQPDFSQHERLEVALKGMANDYASSVADSGHVLAIAAANASTNKAAFISEQLEGLTQVALLNQLSAGFDAGQVTEKLKAIHEYILDSGAARCSVVCESSTRNQHETQLSSLLDQVSWTRAIDPFNDREAMKPNFEQTQYQFSFPINFCARSFVAVPYAHNDSAALAIYCQLATHHFLHQAIREKGGAYGAGARYSALNGNISFFSYRDPNSSATLDAYTALAEWSKDIVSRFGEQELHEAKLGVLKTLDAPLSASEEGMSRFRYGLSDDIRLARRHAVLSTTLDDVERVANQYIVGKPHSDAIIGSAEPLEGFKVIPFQL